MKPHKTILTFIISIASLSAAHAGGYTIQKIGSDNQYTSIQSSTHCSSESPLMKSSSSSSSSSGGLSGTKTIRSHSSGPNGKLYLRGYDGNGSNAAAKGGLNAKATMFNQPTWSSQKWEFISKGGDFYNLRVKFSGPNGRLYLRGYNGTASSNAGKAGLNAKVTMFNQPDWSSMQWEAKSSSGLYTFRCKYAGGPNGRLYLRGYDGNGSNAAAKGGLNAKATMFNQPTWNTHKWTLNSTN